MVKVQTKLCSLAFGTCRDTICRCAARRALVQPKRHFPYELVNAFQGSTTLHHDSLVCTLSDADLSFFCTRIVLGVRDRTPKIAFRQHPRALYWYSVARPAYLEWVNQYCRKNGVSPNWMRRMWMVNWMAKVVHDPRLTDMQKLRCLKLQHTLKRYFRPRRNLVLRIG